MQSLTVKQIKKMKKSIHLLLVVCSFIGAKLLAQTPTACFEIESILADACGTPEWENEMVRIKIGPADLNVSNMVIDWPNNAFYGLCQNATTATKTAAFNATIVGCGLLKEPIGGVLPAGSSVLIITSTAVSTTANSFANLNDTLIVIYQCSGSTAGHFVNYNATPGLRTLQIDFTSPLGCTDVVTYDRALLINQNGGQGGSSALNDGARIDFAWDGTPTYANDGCQAPIIASGIDITTIGPLSLCPGANLNLTAAPYGNFSEIIWQGGTGIFSANNVTTTTYQSTTADNQPFYLYAGIKTTCLDTIYDSILVNIVQPTVKAITPSSYNLCPGESVTLTASGGTGYAWSNFSISPSITVSSGGTYSVGITDGCYFQLLSAVVTNTGTAPTVSVSGDLDLCSGESTTLTATGNGTFLWNGSVAGNTFTTTVPGNYSVTATNGCGVVTQNFTIVDLGSAPNLAITGSLELCNGSSTTISASGATAYEWSDMSTGTTFTTSVAGDYSVTASNVCGSQTIDFEIVDLGAIPTLVLTGDFDICQGETTTITASGGNTYVWNGTTTGTTFTTGTWGNYTVEATNACGSVMESFTIVDLGTAPTISIAGNLAICDGETTTISASGASGYIWSDNSMGTNLVITIPGDYSVSSTNVCGTDQVDFTIVDLGSAPTIAISGNLAICDGETTTLTAVGNGSIVWNTTTIGATFTTNTPGTYVVEATNSCGSALETVIVQSLGRLPNASVQGTMEVCSEDAITNLTVSGGDDYLWSNGNAASVESFGPGSYFVVAYTNCGIDTAYFEVINYEVEALFAASTTVGTEPLQVEFANQSINAMQYTWNLGVGDNSTQTNPSITYNNDGVYTVVLTASNVYCADSSMVLIVVNPLTELIIPNIFTPNNDGFNDMFLVENDIITSIEGSIFNRWGQQLYTQTGAVFSWDGTTPTGNNAPEGTYYYVLNITLINGEQRTFNSHFELKR
jgi:gliding motility-associated-like protein